MRTATNPSATQAASAAPDEVIFTDGATARGKVLFVQCIPGVSAAIQPSIQFHNTDFQAKSTIPAASIRTLLLADGRISLAAANDPAAPVPKDVVDYLRDHHGSSSSPCIHQLRILPLTYPRPSSQPAPLRITIGLVTFRCLEPTLLARSHKSKSRSTPDRLR